MNKDVIYIDVEDDITAIIGKVKASSEKIVALVPPKHVGILQSAVNLRLLQRMATHANKRLVLITNNQALIALSASAKIPVAKNLQTKPELAEITALSLDDGDDIIDGSQLPIGELEKTADVADDGNDAVNSAISNMNIDEKAVSTAALGTVAKRKLSNVKSGVKVPNFNTFRKKLFIGIAAFVLLVGFLVWAIWFAPAAKVIITAHTNAASVNTTATLGGNAATDVAKGMIQSSFQQTKKDVSVDFDATGTDTVGDKSTGSVVFQNCETNTAQTIPSGTAVSNGAKNYITQSSVTVPAAAGFATCSTAGTSTPVAVLAQDIGPEYDQVTNTTFAVAEHGSTSGAFYFKAVSSTAISGGTSREVKIVTAEDVQKASAALVEQPSDQIKAQLAKLFVNGESVIDDSFTIDRATAVSVPAVGAEATGKAKLTSSSTYTISAIAKSDLEIYLKANLEKQLVGKDNQRIYDNGADKVKLSGYTKAGDVATVKIVSTGQIGPKIDESAIKEQIKGKIFGEVQSTLESINKGSNVDVQFSYFWVRTVPNDVNKITVEFKLENE